MKYFILMLCFSFSAQVFSQNITLGSGTEYTYIQKSGRVNFVCGTTLSNSYKCFDHSVSPSIRSHIYYKGNKKVSSIELTAHHQQFQTKQTIKRRFIKRKQRSRRKFLTYWPQLGNLALFREGLNVVDYDLKLRKNSVERGQFEVQVTREERQCELANLYEVSPLACQDQTYGCEVYFHKVKNCL